MPRRPGFAPAEAGFKAPDLSAAAASLRRELSALLTDGTLDASMAPCWDGRGSRFQLLEWIGDSVLHLYLTQHIHDLLVGAGAGEGQMSELRSHCESTATLCNVFKALVLGPLLRGIVKDGPNYIVSEKKCADVVESIIGELFETAKRGGSSRDADAVPAVTELSASDTLAALLEFVFHMGLQESPQRLRPGPVEIALLRVQVHSDSAEASSIEDAAAQSHSHVRAAAPLGDAATAGCASSSASRCDAEGSGAAISGTP
eukprot:TRINITY_DN29835_c0_g1_i1.p1 TRINITY_DN29835_c0_g1~~TRINITY_DN29835_c0_g1_i1.p1  ORF type:complete len:259 (-),score=47.48 TRINITY_DN29835_c0_g1_i1:52-828(-)